MAQRHVEVLIGRLITDEAFRASFSSDPLKTLERFAESGHELTAVEIAALQATRSELWSSVADQLDPRLQKASFSI